MMKDVRTRLFAPMLLFTLTALLFAFSVYQRAPWFGATCNDMTGALTTGSALMAKHWHQEGAWKLRFTMYWEPDSIEYPTLASRKPYVSYPPGSILPIYFLGELWPGGPTPTLVMVYNLANHFLIALTLALLAWAAIRRMGLETLPAFTLALGPPLLYLFLPSPFYEHQMGYFSDQAIMLPYALLVYLEVLRQPERPEKQRRLLDGLQAAVIFWGIFTDWLFPFVVLTLYAVRLFQGQLGRFPKTFLKRSILFWSSTALALGLFALQLYRVHAFESLFYRFVHRSAVDGGSINALMPRPQKMFFGELWNFTLSTRFWETFIPHAYHPLGKLLILACGVLLLAFLPLLAFLRLRGKPISPAIATAGLVLVLFVAPCFIHVHILKNHSSFLFHFFSVLKFALTLSVLPFTILPALLLALVPRPGPRRFLSHLAAPILLGLVLLYVFSLGDKRHVLYGDIKLERKAMAEFVGAHTGYNDVVFSVDQIVQRHFVVYSMKVVHRIKNIQEMYDLVKGLPGPYIINLFSKGPEDYAPHFGLPELAGMAYEQYHVDDLHLRKISKEDFLAYYDRLLQTSNPPPLRKPTP